MDLRSRSLNLMSPRRDADAYADAHAVGDTVDDIENHYGRYGF